MKRGTWKPARVPIPRSVRRALYERDGGRCRYCGHALRYSEVTLDHVLAHSKGGADTAANLVVACRACNGRKHALPAHAAGLLLRAPEYRPPQSSAERHAARKHDQAALRHQGGSR